MPSSVPDHGFAELSVPEKMELIARIWDRIPDSLEGVPLPDWHRTEIERRLQSADANPDAAIPWEQVKARLRKRT